MKRIVLAASLLTSLGSSAQDASKVMNLSPSPFTVGAYKHDVMIASDTSHGFKTWGQGKDVG